MSAFFVYPSRTNTRTRARPRYSAPPLNSNRCSGFLDNGEQCSKSASYGSFCSTHDNQYVWTFSISIEERRARAPNRCSGWAPSKNRLCESIVGGYRGGYEFCWRHVNQRPPDKFFLECIEYYEKRKKGGLELTTGGAAVKENMMAYCYLHEQQNGARAWARKKAEEEVERRRRKEAEEARRAQEEDLARHAEKMRKLAEMLEKLRQQEARRKAAEEEWKRKAAEAEAEKRRKAEEAARAKRMKDKQQQKELVAEYRRACDRFDESRFSESNRASFKTIPWPVLAPRSTLTAVQINWESVEKFFQLVRDLLGADEQRRLLEKARLRYHPDRWAAKRVAKSILDDKERKQVEEAGKIVAQAIQSLLHSSSL